MNPDVAALAEISNNLTETAKRLTLLATTVDRNTVATFNEFREAVKLLTQTVAGLRSDVNQLIQDSGNRVEKSAGIGVSAALESGTAKYNQAVNAAASTMSGSAREFVETLNAVLAKVLRHLWTSFAAVAGAIVLLLGGGGLLIWHETQSYNDAHARTAAAQVDAETMEAYAQVGMTTCGGRPCVKLDAKSPRWGDKGQYVLLDLTSKPKSATSKN